MAYDTLIDTETLSRHLDDPQWRIVDCRFDLANTVRGEGAYASAHVPGALYAHIDRDLSGPITASSGRHPLPDPARFCAWLADWAIEPVEQVVAYDDSGGTMAVRLWWLLRWLGYHNTALLDGGWQAWEAAGLPTSDHPPALPAPTRLDCTADPSLVVDTGAIRAWSERPDAGMTLIDARTTERFVGESEPIDPVAGHIPGAINLPLQNNLDEAGCFRSPAALQDLYRSALGSRSPDSVVAMCGSGVTACHDLLAMEIAGLSGGRLYAGSWSEWIRDPSRPVATGP